MENTALLLMDMQLSILRNLTDAAGFVGRVSTAVAAARKKGMLVIYVRVGFRKNTPEISPNNKSFSGIKDRVAGMNPEEWMRIHPDLSPHEDDIIVTKRRISAFTGSDLEVVLRAKGIQHLVLTGISTSGVVLSTVREAADKDYRLTVLSDGCADPDEEVHRVLSTKVFARQAEVLTVAEWCEYLNTRD